MRAVLIALFLVASGCATPVDDKTADSDSVSTETDAGADSADSGKDSGTDSGTPADSDTDVGACEGDADAKVLDAAAATLGSAWQTCTTKCASSDKLRACVAECVVSDVGVTPACAECFGTRAACVAGRCATPCADPGSQACKTCRTGKCDPAFSDCAGIAAP